jgi:uncharacterized protein (DUF1778 family)
MREMRDDADADFASAIRRAGITIPEERVAVMREAYRDFQKLLALLDEPFGYADEPAATLDLTRRGKTR